MKVCRFHPERDGGCAYAAAYARTFAAAAERLARAAFAARCHMVREVNVALRQGT